MAWTGSTSPGFPPATARHILERDPFCRCTGCPDHGPRPCTKPSTEADHITPTHLGGTNHIDNGRGLCHNCHQIITNQQAAAARRATLNKRLHPTNRPAPDTLTTRRADT